MFPSMTLQQSTLFLYSTWCYLNQWLEVRKHFTATTTKTRQMRCRCWLTYPLILISTIARYFDMRISDIIFPVGFYGPGKWLCALSFCACASFMCQKLPESNCFTKTESCVLSIEYCTKFPNPGMFKLCDISLHFKKFKITYSIICTFANYFTRMARQTLDDLKFSPPPTSSGAVNHVLKSSASPKIPGMRKFNRAHSSSSLFCNGVPAMQECMTFWAKNYERRKCDWSNVRYTLAWIQRWKLRVWALHRMLKIGRSISLSHWVTAR